MRVGIVIDDLDRRRGGMSEWCWQFVCAAANRGHELHIISQGFGDGMLPPHVVRHSIVRTNSRLAFAEAATLVLEELDLDVVHDMGIGRQFDIFQPHGGSYTAWLRRRLDMHPLWLRAVKRPIDAMLPRHRDFARHARLQFAAAQHHDKTFIALSNMVANDFVRFHAIRPERIATIYNGVDCQRYSPEHRARYRAMIRTELGIDEKSLLLLLAAHNFRLKGVPELLAVAARLVANRRPVHVAVAGGKRLEKWRRAAARYGLAGRVSFLGTITDLVPYYAAADAFVHPTYYDPCSLVLLEAAASGLPIVTTRRCNGAAELFRDGDEILTINDPSDGDSLYKQIEALLDGQLRQQLGTAARQVALRHTFDRNVAEILNLYEARGRRRLAA